MARISIKNTQGNASELEFSRGGNANWLLTSDKGYLRFQSDWNGTKGSYEDVLVLSEATSGDATFKGSINASKNIFASYPTNGESDVGACFASGKYLYLWGDTSTGGRGLWDSTKGGIIGISDSGVSFNGTATLANALTTSTAGNDYKPVYFSGGKPVACAGVLPVYYNSSWNCNTIYDASIYLISGGSNCPSGSQYGMLLTLPYRTQQGNKDSDYGAQIFLPNGDDNTTPDGMFYRTSLHEYRGWKSVIHSNSKKYYGSQTDMTNSSGATAGDIFFVIG